MANFFIVSPPSFSSIASVKGVWFHQELQDFIAADYLFIG
jgi:hypothetical protein